VAAGDTVKLGQQIGTVGTSALLESAVGDHVHFSVTCNDESVDPQVFLGQK
jgi:murein DD-endopeptidase MepM/ murein hydrolase activator NlpD